MDALKDSLDQSHFQSLYYLHSDEWIVNIRKAEFLLSIESDDEALALLKGSSSLLARGLEAKILASQGKLGDVEKLCTMSYRGDNEIEKEGQMHLFEMGMWAAFSRQDYKHALEQVIRAEYLAEGLGMRGRLKTLATHKEVLYGKLGMVSVDPLPETGNAHLNEYALLTRYRTLLLAKEFKAAQELKVEEPLQRLAKCTQYRQQNRFYEAARDLREPSGGEFLLYYGLLMLELAVKINDPKYASVAVGLKSLKKALAEVQSPAQIIEDAKVIYPLGVVLAAEVFTEFKASAAQVGRVYDERYRDGVRFPGRIVVLNGEYRRALIRGRLEPERAPEYMNDLRREYRHRGERQMQEAGLELSEIVAVAEVAQARVIFSNLSATINS